MKENKILKFTGMAMFVSVIAVVLVSGTYAKYTSSASGSDTATVAKWDIKATGENGDLVSITGSSPSISFDLFNTIYDTDGKTEEGNVASGKIAPGTTGGFNFSIDNDSEVNAEYTINFTITDNEGNTIDLPLEFSINDGTWGTLNNITAQPLSMNDATTDEDEGLETVNVKWKWAYERTDKDAEDTELGIDASGVKVNATLVVSQVD